MILSLLILHLILASSTLIEVVLSTLHTLFTYFSKVLKIRFLVPIFCNLYILLFTYFPKLLKLKYLTHIL